MEELIAFVLIIAFIVDIIVRIYQVTLPKSHLNDLKRELYAREVISIISDHLKGAFGEDFKAAAYLDRFIDEKDTENLKETINLGNKLILQGKKAGISNEDLDTLNKASEVVKKIKNFL